MISPTTTPTKMDRKYHAWGVSPSGVGRMARRAATMTGENLSRIFM
jgi:hypothetical protein